jgi:hypothetical protein
MAEQISIFEFGETAFDLVSGEAKKIGDRMFSTTTISDSSLGDLGSINLGGSFNLMSLFGGGAGGGSASGPIGQVGQVLGVLEQFLKDGKRPPSTLISNNPLLSAPNFKNQQLYGEMMNYIIAWDQPLKRKVAVFPGPENGGGSMFDNFNMSSVFSGAGTVSDVIEKAITKGQTFGISHPITDQVTTAIANVTNLLSIAEDYSVELSRPDHAIPLGAAIATALSGDTKSPFSEDAMKKGWLMYKAVRGV